MHRLVPSLALILATIPATAASLRTQVTLTAPVVRLSDLFEDADDAARILGAGPAPGARVVVEARQLAAIARQFGVDWRPASGTERVVIDRPGRMLPREEVIAALRGALQGLGAESDAVIELPSYAAPLMPPDGKAQISVEQIDQDGTGRFTAQLAIIAEGAELQRMRLSGTVVQTIELPVPDHKLAAGTVIRPGDLRLARIRTTAIRGEPVHTIEQAVGQSVRVAAMPGQPLVLTDLVRPVMVAKGAMVVMRLSAPGIQLLGQGRALEQGAFGERILVLNPGSKAIVEAEVIGHDRVSVAPGSSPVQVAGTQQVAVR